MEVYIRRSVINSILSFAKLLHPREGVLLLRGRFKGSRVDIEEVLVPPLSTHGKGFSAFSPNMLPMDFSIIGTAHTHPSGAPHPSIADLNNFYGKVMIIAAYPYISERNVIVINRFGERLNYKVVEG